MRTVCYMEKVLSKAVYCPSYYFKSLWPYGDYFKIVSGNGLSPVQHQAIT